MEQYTIRALTKLRAAPSREYITRKELLGLREKFKQSSNAGAAAAVTAKNNLGILDYLLEKFSAQSKISIPELLAAGDNYLRRAGYVYKPESRPPASTRRLYPANEVACYDLAFYLAGAHEGKPGGNHHGNEDRCSIFYARPEHWDKTMVWGNLQIDFPSVTPEEVAPEIAILLRRRNLYQMMVQEVIKHALTRKMERIIFQAGTAAAWAQWQKKFIVNKTLITSKNYSQCLKKYQAQCAQFEQIPLGLYPPSDSEDFTGDYDEILLNGRESWVYSKLLVYAKTSERIDTYRILNGQDCVSLLNALRQYYSWPMNNNHGEHAMTAPEIFATVQKIHKKVLSQEPRKILAGINKILHMVIPDFVVTNSAQKIKYLEALPLAELGVQAQQKKLLTSELPWLDDFLKYFDMDKLVLAGHPEIKAYDFPEKVLGRQRVYFIPSHPHPYVCSFHRADIRPPKIGDCYYEHQEQTAAGKLRPIVPARLKVYHWYENILPKIFTTLGLKFKKSSVACLRRWLYHLRLGNCFRLE